MFGCTNAVREIVKEAPIYRREHAVNLGIVPYLFSKIAILGVLCLLQSAVLVVIVNVAACSSFAPGYLPASHPGGLHHPRPHIAVWLDARIDAFGRGSHQ